MQSYFGSAHDAHLLLKLASSMQIPAIPTQRPPSPPALSLYGIGAPSFSTVILEDGIPTDIPVEYYANTQTSPLSRNVHWGKRGHRRPISKVMATPRSHRVANRTARRAEGTFTRSAMGPPRTEADLDMSDEMDYDDQELFEDAIDWDPEDELAEEKRR